MDKRTFLKTSGLVAAGALIGPNIVLTTESSGSRHGALASGPFTLPDLPYQYDALEPYIDGRTMRIHHDQHHAGYTAKLNAALEDLGRYEDLSITDILASVTSQANHVAIRNNGGGYYNHSLYWEAMSPQGGGAPHGKAGKLITEDFGSFEAFKKEFAGAALSVFGSGWAWLSLDGSGNLFASATPNQDNPLMRHVVERPGTPLTGIDVWEHAYYLKHQNERDAYIDDFFKVIDWNRVNQRIEEIR